MAKRKNRGVHTSYKDKAMHAKGEQLKQKDDEQELDPAVDLAEKEKKKADEESNLNEVDLLKKELAEIKDKYLRTMAEFENFRRRSTQEKADWIRHATKELALHICDIADNFERALFQAQQEDLSSPFGKGIVLIEKQLLNALEREGVKKIEALGNEFDPAYHEALAHIPSNYEENIVAAIIQNGYTMHDKVIRPARVAVSNGNKMNTQEE
ncbi:MAG: nucleotide exchange factor GrpE [Candidatus Cloacimonetes bacterium]|jgi:molecular chaperone GrpE|nr:nucleotide exchange factor GrpE [Candidatus Cloacimonadota bacterium]MDD4232159.1 nucleotide exchange factor GrpE [Candidatus Cloacimonadota bacterium]MDY0299614.1 nucleotide exchange factor GrpE [Candidatus Cloacimonadaceae bacterium]